MIEEKGETEGPVKRNVNLPYLIGYLATLLLGSLQFGKQAELI